MKIGYPCVNLSIGCKSDRTFRLNSYSEERLINTIENNLSCLYRILQFNVKAGLLFFRITSDLIPFASHPVCQFPWQDYFREIFREIGLYIENNRIRISIHPDQFTLINSIKEDIFERSVRELQYHAQVLELLGLDTASKIQIHVGGVYGHREQSMNRFVERFQRLDPDLRKWLVIENDDRFYSLRDCMQVSEATGIPVLFDAFHHELNNNGESRATAMRIAARTWQGSDGQLMVDYSSQDTGKRRGAHAEMLDEMDFVSFMEETSSFEFDLMLEIKDKEQSALKAYTFARRAGRVV